MAVKITKIIAPMASSNGASVTDPADVDVAGAAFAETSRNATHGMSVTTTPRQVWPKLQGTMPTRPKRGVAGSYRGAGGPPPAGTLREKGGGMGGLAVSPSRTDMGISSHVSWLRRPHASDSGRAAQTTGNSLSLWTRRQ